MTLTIDVSAGVNVSAGLGRYTRSLVNAMLPYTTPQLFYNVIPERTQPVPEWQSLQQYTVQLGYKPWRMAVWTGQQARLPFNPLVPGTTVFHATEHLLMPLRGVKTVITVHDLIFKLFPEHHKRLNYWFLNSAMPLFVKRADAVIAISEATKHDLIQHYGTPPEKIIVVYEAASANFVPQSPERVAAVRRQYHLPRHYILVVGTIEPRKNYPRLVDAMHQIRQDHPDLHLVVVGSKGWMYDPFFAHLESIGADQWVHFPGFIPDDDLPAIYGGAFALAMPSIYEGFGLPVLEAMACGIPVISSHAASLPELGGDAALYFDPHQTEAIADTLRRLLSDEDERTARGQRGIQQAGQFSWDRAARETLAVYNALSHSMLDL
jgi:glycosyltransferase involved in cell wall biosynthesis